MFNFSRRIAVAVTAVVLGSFVCLPGASASASQEAVVSESSNTVVQSVRSTQPAVTLTKTNGRYYVNNHEITFHFSYDSEFHDRTAWYVTHLHIDATPTTTITSAEVGDFDTNWDYSRSQNNVLAVHATQLNGFVNRRSGGAYHDINDAYPVKETTVMVDPGTGRVFDFLEGNYFYKYGFMRYRFFNSWPVICEGC